MRLQRSKRNQLLCRNPSRQCTLRPSKTRRMVSKHNSTNHRSRPCNLGQRWRRRHRSRNRRPKRCLLSKTPNRLILTSG